MYNNMCDMLWGVTTLLRNFNLRFKEDEVYPIGVKYKELGNLCFYYRKLDREDKEHVHQKWRKFKGKGT